MDRGIDLDAIARKYNLSSSNESTKEIDPPKQESKSVAFAMRALQERIRVLEQENESLKKSSPGQEALQEQLKFLQVQIEFADAENKRKTEQYEIDKQNWALEIQHLKKKEHQGETLKTQNELFIEKKKNEELCESLQDKENQIEDLKKDLSQAQFLLAKTQEDMRELEKKNHELQFTIEEQKAKIVPKKPPKRTNRRSLSASRSTSSLKNTSKKIRIPSPAPAKTNTKKTTLAERIQKTEKELSELNHSYKTLLVSTNEEFSDFTVLRKKLDDIALLMEKKSEQLYSLKVKHQVMLKKKIGN